ncbi:MAG: slipin family protein [Treponema sp.]|jgi:regulator of protease activity HflC (stomatin/prohibitin superfamily)|nr:slipin family protein [Treponema sp.]
MSLKQSSFVKGDEKRCRNLMKNHPASRLRDFTGMKLFGLIACVAGIVLGLQGERGILGTVGGNALTGISVFTALYILLVPAVRKIDEWERAIVLRLGRFQGVKGPGLVFLIPLFDRISQIIDIRIRVTDFTAQETLTRDSVTVNVDAFAFWLVWDPQKAALEVEDYTEAVVLASQAALRNAVSSNDLSTFLERGDLIEKHIQAEVERQTTEWGITVQYIEITDVQIPEALQDSLSRIAQAEREKQGRILLADAEIQIARKLEEAVAIYAKNEPAMKLKILSILNEGLKAGNSMMLVPNSITEELKAKDMFGLEALTELRHKKKAEE